MSLNYSVQDFLKTVSFVCYTLIK